MAELLIDLIDRVGAMLEPTPTDIAIDTSARAPDVFEPGTLYVFPDGDSTVDSMETGPPSRESFDLIAVLVADDEGEESRQQRTAGVTEVLSSKRDEYQLRLAAIRSCDLWANIDASVDADWTSNFNGRAVALRIRGYRFLT